ncbi:MAG: hypothetical protein QOF68_2491 [Gaiellales bacterium]|nr:hypothetical protein [Gaiellales bacterium]
MRAIDCGEDLLAFVQMLGDVTKLLLKVPGLRRPRRRERVVFNVRGQLVFPIVGRLVEGGLLLYRRISCVRQGRCRLESVDPRRAGRCEVWRGFGSWGDPPRNYDSCGANSVASHHSRAWSVQEQTSTRIPSGSKAKKA